MSHLFSCLLMLISCHVCSCRILQSSSPQIGMFLPSATQPGTDALAFTLHLHSPLSPTPIVPAVRVSHHSSILFSSFLFFLSSYASLCFLSDSLPAHPVLYLLHPPNPPPHHYFHVFLFILAFSSCIPLLICFPSSSIPPCQPEVFF